MTSLFHDRRDAGKELAKKLAAWVERDDVIVLALPRGGVPVAFEIAQHLHAPLDLMLVRKLGAPGQKELALGAVALPNICVFNHDVILSAAISQQDVNQMIVAETKELQLRNHVYRKDEPVPDLQGRIVILVDDGAATGATMHAAINAVAQQQPRHVIAAIPVSSREAYEQLRRQADDVVCLHIPAPFFGVGAFYEDFSQTADEEVVELLAQARHWGRGSVHFVAAKSERLKSRSGRRK